MREFAFTMHRAGGVEVFEMAGGVDALAFAQFAATLTRTIDEMITPCIILDCSRVTYIGSAELRELIGFAQGAQARGGDLKFVGMPQTIRQVANLIGVADLMESHDHLAEAIQAFRGSAAAVAG